MRTPANKAPIVKASDAGINWTPAERPFQNKQQ
jgi:hypothetical protein